MPIDYQEMTKMIQEIADMSGQASLLQSELAKQLKRLRKISQNIDEFGDPISDEQKEALFAKAKEEFLAIKETCKKSFSELPIPKRETIPGR